MRLLLLFALLTQCIQGYTQYILQGSSHMNTSYEMGQFIESWDSISYTYDGPTDFNLTEHQAKINNYGRLDLPYHKKYSQKDHLRLNYNDDLIIWNRTQKTYENSLEQMSEYYSYNNYDSPGSYFEYIYDEDKLAVKKFHAYSSINQTWKIPEIQYYSYDNKGRIIELKKEVYFTSGLNNVQVDSTFYNGDDVSEHKNYRGDTEDALELEHQYVMDYNEYGQLEHVLVSSFYPDNSSKVVEDSYFYYENQLLDSVYTVFNLWSEEEIRIRNYSYDEAGNLTQEFSRDYDSFGIFDKTIDFTYYDQSFIKSYHAFYSDATYGETVVVYHYGDALAVNNPSYSKDSNTINLAPNPVSGQLYIDYEANIDRLQILNLNGQLLREYRSYESKAIDVSNLQCGFYILQIQSGNKNVNKRFVKN